MCHTGHGHAVSRSSAFSVLSSSCVMATITPRLFVASESPQTSPIRAPLFPSPVVPAAKIHRRPESAIVVARPCYRRAAATQMGNTHA